MKCEGFPEVGCPTGADATNDMLGYQLCDACADNWRGVPSRDDEHAGGTVGALREQLSNLHEAIGSALALLRQGDRSAGMALLEEAMKGQR